MTTLIVKDLATAADLDASAMSAVRGGCTSKPSYSWCGPAYTAPSYCPPVYGAPAAGKLSVDASQMIGQSQNVVNNNGNNVAFASGIHSTVNPTQSANNSISF